jgi:hypothetical protein
MSRASTKCWVFEHPKLASYLKLFMKTGCDWDNAFPRQAVKPFRAYVHENIPMVMLGDGFHFMEVEFTKEAMNIFQKENNHVTFNNLRDRILYIVQWSLKLVFRDSYTTLNSYQNLSIVLVVERFKPIMNETPQQRQIHHCTNVFAEKEIKAYLENTRHQFIGSLLTQKEQELDEKPMSIGVFTMPKMSDLFASTEIRPKHKLMLEDSSKPITNRLAACGILRMNYDYLPDMNGITTNDRKEYSNALLTESYRSAALTDSELNYFKNDNEDFTEFRLVL